MMKKILNIAYWIILVFLVVIGGFAALSALEVPKQYQFFVVQSGSMEPAIKTGSLVVVKPSENYLPDDVITFKDGNNTVTHRLMKVDYNDGIVYQTKGDANNTPDLQQIRADKVIGKVIFNIPFLGYPVGFAKTPTGFILLVIIPATIIVYSELMNIKNETVKLLAERKR
ncbi:signal peptidase I, partial [Patescibacteria group bacterium]|nr:signal peptidase I [Patescibacteria group bacterium]